MANTNLSIFILVATILAQATLVPAGDEVEYLVGDDRGWTENVDFKAWANGKEFYMGDRLVFNYTKEKHNVIKVDEAGLNKCSAAPENEVLVSGNDVIMLASMGGIGFISGVGKDCENGMKLFLTDVKCPYTRPKALQAGRKLQIPTN